MTGHTEDNDSGSKGDRELGWACEVWEGDVSNPGCRCSAVLGS